MTILVLSAFLALVALAIAVVPAAAILAAEASRTRRHLATVTDWDRALPGAEWAAFDRVR